MSVTAIVPVTAVPLLDRTAPFVEAPLAPQPTASFAQMLLNGIDRINQKALDADNMVRDFALDDSVPVHQVTFALQQAQSSLEMALQIRSRLLDGYQQLMNMQL